MALEVSGGRTVVAERIRIGARKLQTKPLLRQAGHCPRPVLPKRGACGPREAWRFASESRVGEESRYGAAAVVAASPSSLCF